MKEEEANVCDDAAIAVLCAIVISITTRLNFLLFIDNLLVCLIKFEREKLSRQKVLTINATK